MATTFLVFGIVFVLSLVPLAYVIVRSYRRYLGARVVTCPESRQSVAVRVKAAKAAWSGVFDEPEMELSSCSRWPDRRDCGQECLAQIEDSFGATRTAS